MAENFPQAYDDLVANTTLLEKHMRDMQVRAAGAVWPPQPLAA